MKYFAIVLGACTLLGAGCSSATVDTTTATDSSTTTATASTTTKSTSRIAETANTPGPWDGSIVMTTSRDGLTFSGKTSLFDRAGVPNLLAMPDGTLILTYQYFSETDDTMFDVIAYSTSTDNGATWSDTAAVNITNLPTPIDVNKKPMDPTLVRTEDGALRLYFTYHEKGAKRAALYSATAEDGDIASPFVVNTTPALTLTNGDLLDPAVVFFDGVWHHYTWKNTTDENYHSTSTDGESFTLQDSISLPMDFLGQVITTDTGLRFYGTGKGGVVSASSTDGYSWTMDSGTRAQGADPGIQQLADGSYVMVYTSMNFNQ